MEQIDSPRLHFLSANPRRNPAVDDHFWQVTIIRAKNQIRNSLKCNRITGFVTKKSDDVGPGGNCCFAAVGRFSHSDCRRGLAAVSSSRYNRNSAAAIEWQRRRATRLRTATKKAETTCSRSRKFINVSKTDSTSLLTYRERGSSFFKQMTGGLLTQASCRKIQ